MSREQIDIVVRAIVIVLSVIITRYVIPQLRSNISATKLQQLKSYAEIAVRCAEQIYDSNKDKKEYAIEYITNKANHMGLYLSYDDIESIVESTVNAIKYGMEYTR